ncbi:FAD-dependent oxidoreductase [Streptomyces niveus]|uniref:FAD-dependent oxidoreductase n=1 Tax=Streptomyces niveus TaxID=193462 RepID=UPI0036C6FE04
MREARLRGRNGTVRRGGRQRGRPVVGTTEPARRSGRRLHRRSAAAAPGGAHVAGAQATRAARRLPGLRVPKRPHGVTGVYDMTDDRTPVYDRTDLDGFYVAIGTSGNQFKNAPLVARLTTTLIHGVEGGHDHDRGGLTHTCEHTGQTIDLGTFSRRRRRRPASSTGTAL